MIATNMWLWSTWNVSSANERLYLFELIYLFSTHLLNTNYMPGTVLNARETELTNDSVGPQGTYNL